MLLVAAAALSLFGVILFGLGLVHDSPGIAMVGAIFIIGVGAAGVTGGFQVEAGETTQTFESESVHALDNISDAEVDQTLDISARDDDPTGVFFGPDGSAMYVLGDGANAVQEYDSGKYDLSVAQHSREFAIAEDGSPEALHFSPDMERMYVAGATNAFVYQYNLTEPGDVTSAVFNRSVDVSDNTSDPAGLAFTPDGGRMYVAGPGVIHEYRLGEAWNITAADRTRGLDVSSRISGLSGLAFGPDGARLLLVGTGSNYTYQYGLNEPYSLDSAYYTGGRLNVTETAPSPTGITYEQELESFFLTDAGGLVARYDSTLVRNETREERHDVYKEVSGPDEFPLGTTVLLAGFVLLVGAAGRASDS